MKTLILLMLIALSSQVYGQSISASQIITILNSQNNSKVEDNLKSMGFKFMSKEEDNGIQISSYMKSGRYGSEHLELGRNKELYMFVYKPASSDFYEALKEKFLTSEFQYSYTFKNAKYYETTEMRLGINNSSSIISFFVPLKN